MNVPQISTPMIDEDLLNICHECVGEELLRKEIRMEGKRGKCSYCGKSRKVVPLPWLAERIDSAIKEHFYLTPNEPSALEYSLLNDKESSYEWERLGQEVHHLIQEMAEINEDVANDVQTSLEFYSGGDPKDFEENPYGEEACYEERGPDTYAFKESWNFFRQEITYRARFFSQFAEQILNEIFHDLDLLKTYDGKSVIRVAGPSTENSYVFRARVSQTQNSLDKILKNPVKELSAPSPQYAKNGRMNAPGISVFYGATDIKTCMAEVRPPVGSHVVIGRFQIIKTINLLDLNTLSQIYVKGSYFDPYYNARKGHAAFLSDLVNDLTKPVMPDEENFEYLPTQVVAEYLSERVKPKLDGIIFCSSQAQNKEQNIILFHNSCAVEPYILPEGTTCSIYYGWRTEDDYNDSIVVYEEETQNISHKNDYPDVDNSNLHEELYDDREATLKLDVTQDIHIHVIKRACYKSSKRYISRHRVKKDQNDSKF